MSRRDLFSILKAFEKQIGKEKLVEMVQQGLTEAAIAGMAKNPAPNRDFATWVKNIRSIAPMFQHALVYKVVEDSPKASKSQFPSAAHIGYAGICHPDFVAARGFNPKIRLIRAKTLMQCRDCCNHRYVDES